MLSQRRIISTFILLIVVGLAYLWLRPAAVHVETAVAARGPMQVTVDEEGETRVRDRFVVAAPLSGRVERITLDAGDRVEEGAVVVRMFPLPLDPRTVAEGEAHLNAAQAAKREAAARVEQARAALDQAVRAAGRARRLATNGTISAEELELAVLQETTRQKELEAAEFTARRADYEVTAAEAALLAASGRTDGSADVEVELRSPVSGAVLRVLEESERVVGVGTPLLEIGDPTNLEIVIDILSTDAVPVRPQAPILIEDWGTNEEVLQARVRLVEPSGFTKLSALGVEEQRVNVIADFVDTPAALGDGYRVEARIVIWKNDDVLKVPSSALFRRRGTWSVFVVEGGKARHRDVEIGHRNPLEAEIVQGLTGGETVILHPSDLLDDGVRVTTTQ
jgi:HlyD family secretion protein